ncbi:MAG: nitroreductase family protein [Gemmatimonadota bacterium]
MSYSSRVLSLARNRQAVRRFADRRIPPDSLTRILECGCHAPSAKEAQPWRFVVVQDALTRHQIAAAAFNHPHVQTAPVLVLACARIHSHVSGNGRPSHPVDVAAATQSMVLAAADMGITASWITGYREPAVRALLGIPNDVPIVSILALGYPEGFEQLTARRKREEVIAWERWDERGGSAWRP